MGFGKAVGDDKVSVETVRAVEEMAIPEITRIAKEGYNTGKITKQVCKSLLVFIRLLKGSEAVINIEQYQLSQIAKIILFQIKGRI